MAAGIKAKKSKRKTIAVSIDAGIAKSLADKAKEQEVSVSRMAETFLGFVLNLDPEIMNLVGRVYDELKELHGYEIPLNVVFENMLLARMVQETTHFQVEGKPSPTANIEFALRPRTVDGKTVQAALRGEELAEALTQEFTEMWEKRKAARERMHKLFKRIREFDNKWPVLQKAETILEELQI